MFLVHPRRKIPLRHWLYTSSANSQSRIT